MYAVTLVLACALSLGSSAGAGVSARSTQQSGGADVVQIRPESLADPGYFQRGADVFIYGTGYDARTGKSFRMTYVKPGHGFTKPRPVLPTLPRWVGGRGVRNGRGEVHMWAPHVWQRSLVGTPYVMFFAGSRRDGTDCIGLATARDPKGPFTSSAKPLRCGTRDVNLIDPAHFRTPDGRHYLVYKRQAYSPQNSSVWAVRINPTGTKRGGAQPFRLIDGGAMHVEAPSLISHDGNLFLFVSRFSYATCRYRTFVYRSVNLGRPFAYAGLLPIVKPDGRKFCGPGGAEVVNDNGTYRIAFHAYRNNPARTSSRDDPRFTWMGRLLWSASGLPYVAPYVAPPPAPLPPAPTTPPM